MHPELRSSYAGRLADAYLLCEMKLRSCTDSIGHVQKLKEGYNDPDRRLNEVRIPFRERKEYFDAFCKLQARVEIVDRNIHDWFIFLPLSMLDHIIGIIETTRLQSRLLHWRDTRFVLSRRTIKQYTVELMNAELAVLAVKRFKATIDAQFCGLDMQRFHFALKHGLRRYLLNHCQFIHIDSRGDIEMEMMMQLQSTQHLEVVIRPAYERRLSVRIDVHPAEQDSSPPPDSVASSSGLHERSASTMLSCAPCCKSSESSPSYNTKALAIEKRHREVREDNRRHDPKKMRTEPSHPTTPLESRPTTPSLFDSDSDSYSEYATSIYSSDDWSICTTVGEEMSDTDSSDTTLLAEDSEVYSDKMDTAQCRGPSPGAPLNAPVLQSWWAIVRDMFRIFR